MVCFRKICVCCIYDIVTGIVSIEKNESGNCGFFGEHELNMNTNYREACDVNWFGWWAALNCNVC